MQLLRVRAVFFLVVIQLNGEEVSAIILFLPLPLQILPMFYSVSSRTIQELWEMMFIFVSGSQQNRFFTAFQQGLLVLFHQTTMITGSPNRLSVGSHC